MIRPTDTPGSEGESPSGRGCLLFCGVAIQNNYVDLILKITGGMGEAGC